MSSMGFDFMSKPTSAIPAGCFDCTEDTNSRGSNKKRAVESSTGGISTKKRAKKTLTVDYTHVLFDIEGTTTPISFVKRCSFRTPLGTCRRGSAEARPTQLLLKVSNSRLWVMASKCTSNGEMVAFLTKYVQDMVAADRKDPAVKKHRELFGRLATVPVRSRARFIAMSLRLSAH